MKIKNIILFYVIAWCSTLSAQEPKAYETETYRTHMALFQSETIEKGSIIFLGNSLTQGGAWDVYFPVQKPVNRGISGDNTDGILARLDGIIEAQPQKLFMLCGVNDVSQNYDNDYICSNIKTIIQRVKAESPETVIHFQSLLPINNSFGRYKRLIGKEKQIKSLNKKIAKLCKAEGVQFINLYPSFQIKKGLLDPKYTTDGLHLNADGYLLWVKLIRDFVEE